MIERPRIYASHQVPRCSILMRMFLRISFGKFMAPSDYFFTEEITYPSQECTYLNNTCKRERERNDGLFMATHPE